MKSLTRDQKRIEEVSAKYPAFCKLGADGVLEFYCDNQILASLRSCQGYFYESFNQNLAPKTYGIVNPDHDNLVIGKWFHSVMELIDKATIAGKPLTSTQAVLEAQKLWYDNDLESYRDTAGYKNIDGIIGALELVQDYVEIFNPSQSNIKLISTELVFGYSKEAPIVDWLDPADNEASYEYRAYLVGRPDGVVETPLGIGPKDYKTCTRVDKVRNMYKPSEQLLGYAYGINKIFSKELAHTGKKCNIAYLIAVNKKRPENPKDRIIKIPYTYSDADFEAYRQRQISTFDTLYEQVVLEQTPTWDTSKCTNWYFKTCPFHKLHSSDVAQREQVIEAFYSTKKPWNPQTRGEEDEL